VVYADAASFVYYHFFIAREKFLGWKRYVKQLSQKHKRGGDALLSLLNKQLKGVI
jgi:hypothetical protein